jgi:hypothetical protein
MQLGVVRILLMALLLSNVRATWIAATRVPGSEEADLPPRLNETFADKFADRLPQRLWPKIRILRFEAFQSQVSSLQTSSRIGYHTCL